MGEYIAQGAVCTHSHVEIEKFKNFQSWILNNAPRVAQMREPFTIAQYCKMQQTYPYDIGTIQNVLRYMDNWLPLLSKNVSAYKTLVDWKIRNG